jgi:predicted nucleic acid-binding protein
MSGTTLDTGALIALEAGSPRMRALVRTALAAGAVLAVPAGVLAQAWRASARQARLAQLLRASVTEVVALDRRVALAVGKLCAATGASDVVDVSVVVCARERGHTVITTDPADLAAIDPGLTVLPPT